jgi:hypothetical protein
MWLLLLRPEAKKVQCVDQMGPQIQSQINDSSRKKWSTLQLVSNFESKSRQCMKGKDTTNSETLDLVAIQKILKVTAHMSRIQRF